MQIVSNNTNGAVTSQGPYKVISPWSAWQTLFHPDDGDEAVIFTGYLSGGPQDHDDNQWREDIIMDIVAWLTHRRPHKVGARRLSIFVGQWNDPGSYGRSVNMLARLLAHIGPQHRQHVSISEVPSLHIKAFAIYSGNAGTTDCIRLLIGSSNLTYSSMAAGNNIELDSYFSQRGGDEQVLKLYGEALRDAQIQCHTSKTFNQAPGVASVLQSGEALVAAVINSDSTNKTKFYNDLKNLMTTYEHDLQIRQKRAVDQKMQDASDECMGSDTNS